MLKIVVKGSSQSHVSKGSLTFSDLVDELEVVRDTGSLTPNSPKTPGDHQADHTAGRRGMPPPNSDSTKAGDTSILKLAARFVSFQ